MPFRLCPPLAANPRMQDLFERALFFCVAKYYGAKFVSIQVPGVGENSFAKRFSDFSLDLRKLDQSVSCFVGIEEFRRGKHPAQTFAKRAFTRGNPSGDPDGRH